MIKMRIVKKEKERNNGDLKIYIYLFDAVFEFSDIHEH